LFTRPSLPEPAIASNSDNEIPTQKAVKNYVDSSQLSSPLNMAMAINENNLLATYNNGTSGVGATLTANSVGVITIDFYNVLLNDRIFFNGQSNDFENDLNKSCVKGRVGVIFSISMAMACASNMPIMIGKRRSPLASVRIKVNDPACNWLGDRSNISSFILSTVQI
jgi:hypothetical protein